MTCKLSDLLQRTDYSIQRGSINIDISGIVYNSKEASLGCLFVCVKGFAVDGHKYIHDAVAKGAVAVVVEENVDIDADITIIRVVNSRKALAELSSAWFNYPAEQLITVGVTGTKGKTTTTYMIRQILERAGIKTGLIGTIEVAFAGKRYPAVNTTPESFLVQSYFREMVDAGVKCVVMEVSSQALKLDRVAGFTFDYGIFTNLEEDHIGASEHPDLADYIHCKSLLFRQCRIGLINADSDYLRDVLNGHTCQIETYGAHPDADLWASDLQRIQKPEYLGVSYTLHGLGKYQKQVQVDIPGDFTVYNSLAAISLCSHLNAAWSDIQNALNEVQVKGRLEVVPTKGNYTLIIDYAHNAMSLEALLKNIRAYNPKRIVCMFGCGGNRAKARRYEMGEVSSRLADLTVVTSDNPRWEEPMDIINDILVGVQKANGKHIVIPDRKEAIRYCLENSEDGDVILLAGKGHEDYQEICGEKFHMDEREIVEDIMKNNYISKKKLSCI